MSSSRPLSPSLSAQELRDLIHAHFAPWVLDLDPQVLSIGTGCVSLSILNGERLHRDGAMASGQALMALADTAMVAALWVNAGYACPSATVSLHTSFMRPAVGSSIIANANVLRSGRTMAFAEATLTNEAQIIVARTAGTYALPPPPKPEAPRP